MKTYRFKLSLLTMFIVAGWILTACSSNSSSGNGITGSNTPVPRTYSISVTNITNNQPISPMAVVMHEEGYVAWRIGEAVSASLELLAESGDPSDLINSAQADPNVLATATGSGVILPGSTDSLDISFTSTNNLRISLATMLVNTNDAITGLDSQSIGTLDVGQSASYLLPAYDAGTEFNSENAGSIPGPAAGGEGFNATRDDSDLIRIHPGVVSGQDGLGTSTLDGSHKWDNPVVKLTVTRTS